MITYNTYNVYNNIQISMMGCVTIRIKLSKGKTQHVKDGNSTQLTNINFSPDKLDLGKLDSNTQSNCEMKHMK